MGNRWFRKCCDVHRAPRYFFVTGGIPLCYNIGGWVGGTRPPQSYPSPDLRPWMEFAGGSGCGGTCRLCKLHRVCVPLAGNGAAALGCTRRSTPPSVRGPADCADGDFIARTHMFQKTVTNLGPLPLHRHALPPPHTPAHPSFAAVPTPPRVKATQKSQINTVPTPAVAWTRAWLIQVGGGGGYIHKRDRAGARHGPISLVNCWGLNVLFWCGLLMNWHGKIILRSAIRRASVGGRDMACRRSV